MSKPEIIVEVIAKTAHEVNRGYCQSIGDDSQPAWADAPDWQKDSAKAGVIGILTGKVKTPEDSHKGWLAQKVTDGWVYGTLKNPERKEHPCMVPYHDLPASQRAKDHLFRAVVLSMMEDFDIVSVG